MLRAKSIALLAGRYPSNSLSLPLHYADAVFEFEQDVKWLQTITTMPILVKGVVTAEDSKHQFPRPLNLLLQDNVFKDSYSSFAARLSIQAGAAGIIVSNHGARQLDYVPGTVSCLEEVRESFELSIIIVIIIMHKI